MNSEEIKLTEYLHNIIEENISLRKQNDILWKQKLDYIGRISKAIETIKEGLDFDNPQYAGETEEILLKILKGDSGVDE